MKFTNDDPWNVFGLVLAGSVRNRFKFAVKHVLDRIGFAVFNVNGTDQHVVGNVVQVTTILEPWTSSTIKLKT